MTIVVFHLKSGGVISQKNDFCPVTRATRLLVDRVTAEGVRRGISLAQGIGPQEIDVAKGDSIIILEPDGTSMVRDVRELLAYSDDFDLLYGRRTFKILIWKGADMGFF